MTRTQHPPQTTTEAPGCGLDELAAALETAAAAREQAAHAQQLCAQAEAALAQSLERLRQAMPREHAQETDSGAHNDDPLPQLDLVDINASFLAGGSNKHDTETSQATETESSRGEFAGTLLDDDAIADHPQTREETGTNDGATEAPIDEYPTAGWKDSGLTSLTIANMLVVPIPLFDPQGSAGGHSDHGGLDIPLYDPEIAIDGMPDIDTTGHLPPVPANAPA